MTDNLLSELKKARFFTLLGIARRLRSRTKTDRVVVLTAAQLSFIDGWNAHTQYVLALPD